MHTLNVLWQRWKAISHTIGTFQARAILTIFYYAVLTPFAIGVRVFSDPLRLHAGSARGWSARTAGDDDSMTFARRQF